MALAERVPSTDPRPGDPGPGGTGSRGTGSGGTGLRGGAADESRARLAAAVGQAVEAAFAEDLAGGRDLTSEATVPPDSVGVGRVVVRETGVVAGLALLEAALTHHDGDVVVTRRCADGDEVPAGTVVARVSGRLRAVLTAERVALNLLGRLSGVATRTRAFVEAVAGTGCEVRDTRKTTPGLRVLEKAAVVAGGGTNHRMGLSDALLVKDNHVAAAGDLAEAVHRALAHAGGRPVQVEIDRPEQLEVALGAGARDVLLDNFTPAELRRAVERVGGRARVEASGGITLATVREVAETGVDRVAVGALTHSAPWLDVALDLAPPEPEPPGEG